MGGAARGEGAAEREAGRGMDECQTIMRHVTHAHTVTYIQFVPIHIRIHTYTCTGTHVRGMTNNNYTSIYTIHLYSLPQSYMYIHIHIIYLHIHNHSVRTPPTILHTKMHNYKHTHMHHIIHKCTTTHTRILYNYTYTYMHHIIICAYTHTVTVSHRDRERERERAAARDRETGSPCST